MARTKIIPKRIGAVKIPKALRKAGDEILADPRARAAAGRALLAIGAALAGRGTRGDSPLRDLFERARAAREPDGAAPGDAEPAGRKAGRKAGDAVNGVAQAVDQVVGEVVERIRRDWTRRTQGPADDPARPARPAPGPEGDGSS